MKPPIPYFGGKITLAPTIAELLPAHQHYVEPYCGSLAVLLAKVPAPFETVNDLNGDLVNFWRVLRDRPVELERACALTPHARVELLNAYTDHDDDLERARRVFVRLTQGRAGVLRDFPTGWRYNVKPSGSTAMSGTLEAYAARITPAATRLRAVSLECMPALDLIAKYGAEPDALLYVDPPYLGSTRCRTWDGYQHDMRSEAQHRELAEALHAARAAVVISGYASGLYDRDLYPGWDRHTMAATTGQGGARTEVLWSNRPLGVQMRLDFDGEDTP